MNERASYYSGSSAISHSRRKQLRRLEGKRDRKTTRQVCAAKLLRCIVLDPDGKNIEAVLRRRSQFTSEPARHFPRKA
jgi:hypothetical protein